MKEKYEVADMVDVTEPTAASELCSRVVQTIKKSTLFDVACMIFP